ncbi:MAG TPA: hypothetical protein VF952_00680 [Chloroflexia bacterium]|jgi:hypothetical protein
MENPNQTVASRPDSESRNNFQAWKRAVGLPQQFPRLEPLSDEELDPTRKFYVGWMHQGVVEEILDRASAPLVAVLVTKGHGCSTLAQYVFKEIAADCVRRRLIPVRLSLDKIRYEDQSDDDPAHDDQSETGDATRPGLLQLIEDTMRRDIVRSMVLHPWDRVLGVRPYAGLIGAAATSQGRGPSDITHVLARIEAQQADLKALVQKAEPNWKAIHDLSPTLSLPIDKLLATLSRSYGVRISLQLDLSSTRYRRQEEREVPVQSPGAKKTKVKKNVDVYTGVYHRTIRDLIGAMKVLHEQESSMDIIPAVLNELYFVSKEGYVTLTESWDREYDEIVYPPYGPADVFAILSYHYQQQDVRGFIRSESLAAVVDSEILKAEVDSRRALTTIVQSFEAKLRGRMSNWQQAAYHIKSNDLEERVSQLEQSLRDNQL